MRISFLNQLLDNSPEIPNHESIFQIVDDPHVVLLDGLYMFMVLTDKVSLPDTTLLKKKFGSNTLI